MSRASRIATVLLFLLLVYYEGYRWLPLGRWNGQFHWPVQNDQFYPDIVIGGLLISFVLAFLRGWRAWMWVSVTLLGIWVGVHFFDWWLPYCQNSLANAARFSYYAPHTQILPVIDHHYPPDGGHTVLDILLYPAWLACLVAVVERNNRPMHSTQGRMPER